MKIGLVSYSDVNNTDLIAQLSNELDTFFIDRYFGKGIKSFSIGVVCVQPVHEEFFKIGKPHYIFGKKEMKMHGIAIIIESNFSFRIKIKFDIFIKSDFITRKKIVVQEIFNSLILLRPRFKEIKDFDFERFLFDFSDFSASY